MADNNQQGSSKAKDSKNKIHHVDVKVLTFPCEFQGGQQSSVNFYIGEPKPEQNPILNQSNWLSNSKGGRPPEAIINSLTTLQKIAIKNNVPLGDLCEYAIKSISGKYNAEDPNAAKAAEQQGSDLANEQDTKALNSSDSADEKTPQP